MDNCFTGRCDRSRQTPEKDVLYIILAGPVTDCAFARWRIPVIKRPARDASLCMGDFQAPAAPHFVFLITL